MSTKLSIHERFAQANQPSATVGSTKFGSRPHTDPATGSTGASSFVGSRSPRLATSVLDAWTTPSPILEQEDGGGEEKEEVKSVKSGRSVRSGQQSGKQRRLD